MAGWFGTRRRPRCAVAMQWSTRPFVRSFSVRWLTINCIDWTGAVPAAEGVPFATFHASYLGLLLPGSYFSYCVGLKRPSIYLPAGCYLLRTRTQRVQSNEIENKSSLKLKTCETLIDPRRRHRSFLGRVGWLVGVDARCCRLVGWLVGRWC